MHVHSIGVHARALSTEHVRARSDEHVVCVQGPVPRLANSDIAQ